MLRIITDTGSDITKEEAEKMNIKLISLTVMFGDEICKCVTNEDREVFFRKLRECKELPTTSQPSPLCYLEEYEEAKEAGDEVIVLALSSELSGTYQSAVMAADMIDYDAITVVDTGSVIMGQRIIVNKAVQMRNEGSIRYDIEEAVNEMKRKIVVCGAVETLEYLKKGGRIPPVLAALGGALKIKPALKIKDGKIINLSKSRGLKQAIQKLYKEYEEEEVDKSYPVYFGYVDIKEAGEKMMKETVEKYGIKHYDLFPVGPTIGAHVGPGCVVMSFVRI